MTANFKNTENINIQGDSSIKEFFDEVLASLKKDKELMEEEASVKDRVETYTVQNEEFLKNAAEGYRITLKKNLKDILITYFTNITGSIEQISKLALYLDGMTVMVWAVIGEDDDKTEGDLFLAEASTNARFDDDSFRIDTTITENTDGINIPPHFILLHSKNALL